MYKELTYIESTGTQYIDTGITGSSDITIDCDITVVETTAYSCLIGEESSGASYIHGVTNSGSITSGWITRQNRTTTFSGNDIMALGIRTNLKCNRDNVVYSNGNGTKTFSVGITVNDFESTATMYLFANNKLQTLGSVTDYSKLRLHYCKIYKDGELIADYIPVKNVNNTVCLYDKVTNDFLYNSGSGVFVAGEEVDDDTDYDELETRLNAILEDKNTNLLPEHLKKGVTCLGVEGSLEGIKLFETKAEMDADTTSEVGQLGVIYRNITTPMAEGMTTDRVGYPRIVTLDTTYGQFGTGLTGTGGDIAVSGSASYSSGRISIQLNDVIVEYTSVDALHWVRQSGPHTQYFGSPITFTAAWAEEAWPMLGHFMVKQDLYQDGLYEYNGTSWEVAPNQFTLVTDTHLMQDLVAYGRDGVVTGTFAGGAKIYPDVQTLLNTYGEPVGDLGLVYAYKEYPVQNGSVFKKVKFNSTVTFSEDASGKFFDFSNPDGDWESGFRIEIGGNYMNITANNYSFSIFYSTTDNLTYTTTEDVSGWYEFNSVVTAQYEWDDALSQLMSIQMRSFDGLYEVREGYDSYATYVLDFSKSPTVTNKEGRVIRVSDIQGVLDLIDFESKDLDAVEIYYDGTYHYAICGSSSYGYYTIRDTSTNKVYWTANTNRTDIQYEEDRPLYKIDLANNTIVSVTPFSSIAISENLVASGYYKLAEVALNEDTYIVAYSKNAEYHIESEWAIWKVASYGGTVSGNDTYYIDNLRVPVTKYFVAPTQFNTTSDYVYGDTIFYGTAGPDVGTLQKTNNLTKDELKLRVDIYNSFHNLSLDTSTKDLSYAFQDYQGDVLPNINTSNVTNMLYMFKGASNLTSVPLFDTSNVVTMEDMFYGCTNLTEVPLFNTSNVTTMLGMFCDCINLTTAPEFNTTNVKSMYNMFLRCKKLVTAPMMDTKNVTSMMNMFYQCENLVNIPLYDTSVNVNMNNAFGSCLNLSDESLNNILMMCVNAVKITSSKTLKIIGLTQEQATKCTTLSNYSAFTAAGWTTGY